MVEIRPALKIKIRNTQRQGKIAHDINSFRNLSLSLLNCKPVLMPRVKAPILAYLQNLKKTQTVDYIK